MGRVESAGACRVDMEKARAGYMVTVRVCIDPASGNTLCNFNIYLFILVLPGHSCKSTLHPLAQTLISLCWRVGRPRSVCRQILYLVAGYSVAMSFCLLSGFTHGGRRLSLRSSFVETRIMCMSSYSNDMIPPEGPAPRSRHSKG